MRRDRILIDYQLAFFAPFHCGTGLRAGLLDRVVRRDASNLLVVPGSTLKGLVREQCEGVVQLLRGHIADEYGPGDLSPALRVDSPHDERAAILDVVAAPTLLARLFGSRAQQGSIYFDDAVLSVEDRADLGLDGPRAAWAGLPQTEERTQVSMSRLLGAARAGMLFTSEYGMRDLRFAGTIRGTVEDWPLPSDITALPGSFGLVILLAGLYLVERLGSQRSSGYGACRWRVPRFTVNRQPYEPADYLGLLDQLHYYAFAERSVMVDYAFTLTAATPLALRAGRNAEQSDTLTYLPGPSLAGALAGAHRELYPDREEEFAAFFLQQRLVVSNAYPATFPDGPLAHPRWPVAPLPATARTCKRYPGFAQDTTPMPRPHGAADQALAWTVFAASGESAVAPLRRSATCLYPDPTCGEPMDAFGGFYRRAEARGEILYGRAPARTALRTSTGINRARGAVQQGVLFTRAVLVTGSRFWWRVRLDTTLDRAFRAFVDEASEQGVWRVGTGRTRGLGRLHAEEPEYLEREAATSAAVRARTILFDTRLREAARLAGVPLSHRCYVPITLTSDLLLRDPLLRWRTCLDGDALAAAGIPGADLVYHAARVHRATGWNGALGLPQPDLAAIAMGSVFIFGFGADPPYEALARVHADGLGLRREIGFGQVEIAGPFHYEVMQP